MTTNKHGEGCPESSTVWNELTNGGPRHYENVNFELREDGVTKFNPTANSNTSNQHGISKTETVWYIEDKHNPKSVINAWLDQNPQVEERLTKWAIHLRISKYGKGFKAASNEILGPFNERAECGGNDGVSPGECPMCGKEYDYQLPTHLREECNA